MAASGGTGVAKRQGKGRWRRVLLWCSPVLALAVALVLTGIAAILVAPGLLVRSIEEQFAVDASVEELSLLPPGSATLRGLALDDLAGRPFVRVGALDASLSLAQAVRGRAQVALSLADVELHVWRAEDGSWSLERLPRRPRDGGADDTGGPGGGGGDRPADAPDPPPEFPREPPPSLALDLVVRDARAVVHAEGEVVVLALSALELHAPALDRPAELRAEGSLAGGDGRGGAFRAAGEVTLFGGDGATAPRGELRLSLEELVLAGLRPLLSGAVPLEELSGTVGGEARVALDPRAGPSGDVRLTAVDLAFRGPGGELVRLPKVSLDGEGAPAGDPGAQRPDTGAQRPETGAQRPDTGEKRPDTGAQRPDTGAQRPDPAAQRLADGAQRLALTVGDVATLDWTGAVSSAPAGPVVAGRLELSCELARAADLARAFTPELAQRALAGSLIVAAAVSADLGAERIAAAGDLALAGLSALDVRGEPLDLAGGLDAARVAFDVSLERGELAAASLELTGPLRLAAVARPADGAGSAGSARSAAGVGDVGATGTGASTASALAIDFELDADLARLAPLARAFAEEPPAAAGRISLAGDVALRADGGLALRAAGAPLALALDGDRLDASRVELALALDPRAPRDPGEDGPLPFDVSATLADVVLAPAPEPGAEAAPPLATPRLALRARGRSLGERTELDALSIDSDAVAGELRGALEARGEGLALDGLHGELTYVPERLGALLAGRLPGALSGGEPRAVRFDASGAAQGTSPAALARALGGDARLSLGRWTLAGLALEGELGLRLAEGALALDGDLAANGGTLRVSGTLAPDRAPVTSGTSGTSETSPPDRADAGPLALAVEAQGVRVDAEVARLLALLHPVFAQAAKLEQGVLDGAVSGGLELSLAPGAALPGWDGLLGGELDPAALAPVLAGRGRLEVSGLAVAGSPLLARLQDELSRGGKRELRLRPMSFALEGGRIRYERPWTWTIGDTETTFTGTVGVDGSLDLAWNVPVDGALTEKYDFLKVLKGESLVVPLRGTADDPQLELRGLVDELARSALKKGLAGELGLKLPGAGGGGDDPAALLARADELWAKGQRAEAAALYRRIREEFKLSVVYALNRDRIKERAKFEE